MITEIELKLENRIIPTGMFRKYFNRFFTKSLTSRCFQKKKWGRKCSSTIVSDEHLCHSDISARLPLGYSKSQQSVNMSMLHNRIICRINCFEIKMLSGHKWKYCFTFNPVPAYLSVRCRLSMQGPALRPPAVHAEFLVPGHSDSSSNVLTERRSRPIVVVPVYGVRLCL
jgi:hypothetical protein